eukprot:SAG31_NODE_23066_length_512_cov_0.750605_1_plen_36_part_01
MKFKVVTTPPSTECFGLQKALKNEYTRIVEKGAKEM